MSWRLTDGKDKGYFSKKSRIEAAFEKQDGLGWNWSCIIWCFPDLSGGPRKRDKGDNRRFCNYFHETGNRKGDTKVMRCEFEDCKWRRECYLIDKSEDCSLALFKRYRIKTKRKILINQGRKNNENND